MNTNQLIKRLKKVSYVSTLRKLKSKEIDIIDMAIHRLENYKKSTDSFLKAK